MGAQPEASEVAHVIQPDGYVASSKDDVDVNRPHVDLDASAVIQTDLTQNEMNLSATHESPQETSSTIIADGESQLPEPSLPIWLADEFGDELNELLPIALRHIKAKRGGDLLGIIMPAAAYDARSKRRGKHFILVIIKGEEQSAQWIRVKRQLIDISYRGQKGLEEELQTSLHLPSFLRKARVLFERDGIASKILDVATRRFRQGPPYPSVNEKISLKAECYHWLGKMQEATDHPDRARYLLPTFLDQVVFSWFRLRGLWHVSAAEELQFILVRDKLFGQGLRDVLNENDTGKQIEMAKRLATYVLKDVPWPVRID
ncbi:MAG: hypothetical protein CMH81_04750 [Nitrospiraceae bacterium]|nr:hypothetical protein [Nitrospiraceae bacterium]